MTQTDLFPEASAQSAGPADQPLALRMSPLTIDEYAGQEELLAPGRMLRRLIESDRLTSAIFFGPPGCGKSALARLIARRTRSHVDETNAVTCGIPDIRRLIEQARQRKQATGRKTILLLDEIHRFNRSQQDALLPDVEKGTITLIGITTENPYFYVNAAILSRTTVFEFKPLSDPHIRRILRGALNDPERGLSIHRPILEQPAEDFLVSAAAGDARRALNALEIAVLTTPAGTDGAVLISLAAAEESIQKRSLRYDKSGDEHYDHASAFIKSMRGSDPDASIYWMARMLASGEDPRFIIRRVIICASEDVGNADPRALILACSALSAIEFVGMPEARIPLSQAVAYVACAPKSNASYLAVDRALQEVENGPVRPVPGPLKDSSIERPHDPGHHKGYLYPHDHPGHHVAQVYWPRPVALYVPSDQGYEITQRERLARLRGEKPPAQ